MVIPYTQWRAFINEWNCNAEWRKHLRIGQAFYNWANMHRMTQTAWHAKLYNADLDTAIEMAYAVMDWDN